jgi:8-oxo-dGTP pyrophosphatase MutT (NUDIX family)
VNYIKQIERYDPKTAKDEAIKRAILRFIEKNQDDVLTRINSIAHFTASSIILNEDSSKMLMIHHKIYNTWTWQGGHADGEEDLLKVALKEAYEETGLQNLMVIKEGNEPVIRLDILPVREHIKYGEFITSHLHLNAAFVFLASEKESLNLNAKETNDIRWVVRQEIDSYGNEAEITPIYHELISRAETVL